MAKSKKIDVEVVSVEKGVLTVITEDGMLEEYLQRGVRENLTAEQRAVAVHLDILVPNWNELPKIPRNWNLKYYKGLVEYATKAFQFPKNVKIKPEVPQK